MGMTIDEIKKDIFFFARELIKVMDNVEWPTLVYDAEKQVVKKALRKYLDELESELRGEDNGIHET